MEAQDTRAARPDNVPADRVFDFDVYDFDIENAEYQVALKALNAPGVPELFWTPHHGGHWIVTRAADIHTVLTDYEHFSSRSITVPRMEGMPPLKPLQVDPPEHMKYRLLLAGALSPKAVVPLGEAARELAIELIEGFKARGECEFIGEFAQHLPIAIFMKLVDLPEADRGLLTGLAENAMRGKTEDIRNMARMQLAGYGMQKVAERRANPGDDLISTIALARVDGELLDDMTLTGMVTLLLFAGLDTVASMLGFFARFLAMHPGHRRQLIEDPSLIPNAVEEMLRRYPIALLAREVVTDFEFGGVTLRKGDMVAAPTPLDGLDERKFDQPLEVDFARKTTIHSTFGAGAHRCMGSMLARTELRIFLEEWIKRIPDFEVKPGAHVEISARSVATITALPLVWKTA